MSDRSYTPDVIVEAIRGDDAALSFLYESTQGKVTQTVRSMIRDEDAVLDIVQDSYIKAFRNLDKLDRPDRFPLWIRRIASNTAVDYLKKKRPMLFSELVAEDGSEIEFEDVTIGHMPEAQLDQKETSRLIREIISGLSEEQQLVIGLFYFEEVPIKAIARKLGCSENTVKSRLNYGRKNIEKQVRELEKKGTKLYSLAPLPFFLWLLRNLHTAAPQGTLGTVLAQCGSVSSGAASTAGGAVAQAGGRIVRKAAEKAGKKIAMKIAAAVLAVTVVGGGTVVALSGGSGDTDRDREIGVYATEDAAQTQQPTDPIGTTNPAQPLDAMQAYQVILDEIKTASRHPFDHDSSYYYHFHEGQDLYYCLYDIDGNGTDELLIGRPGDIMDIFTFDGENTQWLINRFYFGMTSNIQLMKTGEVYVHRANTNTYVMMRLEGSSFAEIFNYQETYDENGFTWYVSDDGSKLELMEFNQLTLNDYSSRNHLRWVQFTGSYLEAAENYLPILNEYAAACADENYLDHREQYPNTYNDGMYFYHAFGLDGISFALFDLDENGIDELFIGTPGDIWDVYTFDGQQPVKLVNIEALGGGRATLEVMDTGEMYIYGSSGAEEQDYQMLRMAEDGISLETVFFFMSKHYESGSYYEGLDGNEHVVLSKDELDQKLHQYNPIALSWASILTPREQAYQDIMDEYIEIVFAMEEGTYEPDQQPHAKNIDREKLDPENMGPGSGFHLAYCYYDIDRNGTMELLIGYATEYAMFVDYPNMIILDVYTFNGEEAVQLFPGEMLGYTAKLYLVNEGEMYLENDKQDGGIYILAQIAPDGYSLDIEYSYKTRLENGQVIYYNDTESYTEFEFNWVLPPLYYDNDIQWTGFTSYSEYW